MDFGNSTSGCKRRHRYRSQWGGKIGEKRCFPERNMKHLLCFFIIKARLTENGETNGSYDL